MTPTPTRAFTMSDNVLLQSAGVFHGCLSAELGSFTARFPWLDAAWLAAFGVEIATANAFPADMSIRLDVGVISSDLRMAMNQGYGALKALAGYATLAWPTDLSRQRAFGQDNWPAARPNTLRLIEAIELAHGTAQDADFKPLLLGKGCTQAAIDQLATLAIELRDRNNLLEAAKADRKVKRHDRIVLLNTVWERMTTLTTCATVVWPTDAARRAQYQRYKGGEKTKGTEKGGTASATDSQ